MNDQNLLQPGRYPARATGQSSVYENAKGSLCLAMEIEIEGGFYKYITTLATEANGINTRSIDTLKQCFGWDGVDFFWFVEQPDAYSDREISATVEHSQGDKRTFVNVAFIDPPGGGGQFPAAGNKQALMAKYGARFRAASGGTPSAPPKPKPPAAPPVKRPDLNGTPSNQVAVWGKFREAHQGKDDDAISAAWFEFIEKHHPGVDQGDLTHQQWGHLFDILNSDEIPF
jgi:hypothetical protein